MPPGLVETKGRKISPAITGGDAVAMVGNLHFNLPAGLCNADINAALAFWQAGHGFIGIAQQVDDDLLDQDAVAQADATAGPGVQIDA